jgi:hypothetical protein
MSSHLTGRHIIEVLEVLKFAENFPIDPSPEQIGMLRGKAASAAITLRVFSGIELMKVEVRAEE